MTLLSFLFCYAVCPATDNRKSIREFGLLPGDSAATNAQNLQKAIDWATAYGAALYVDHSDEPYHIDECREQFKR